jgi:hypothetical protein
MTPEELLEEWTSGESTGMRPQRVQAVREELAEYTGQAIPRRIPDIAAFLDNPQWKGTITQKLREEVGDADSDGSSEPSEE